MSMSKAMQARYDEIAALLVPYCDEYLNEEYKDLSLLALEKLCRKRPSVLVSGSAAGWASGIVYALGQCNRIFDKYTKVHRSAAELSEPFGVTKNTAAAKANIVKDQLKMSRQTSEWLLPSDWRRNFYAVMRPRRRSN